MPYHFEEVLARMQALLRRAGGWASPVLECGPIRLDTRATGGSARRQGHRAHHVRVPNPRAHDAAGRRCDFEDRKLTERLYDQDFERDSNVIEVFIGRLRRKLDPDEKLHPIETLRGRGYRFSIARTQGS